MLSVNGKISRDLLRADTMWLRRPELNVERVTWQHVTKKAVKREGFTWGQRAGGWREMLLIKKSSKSECRYRLVVKLKAIEYKENFLCYLSSYRQSSLQAFSSPWSLNADKSSSSLPSSSSYLEYVQSSPQLIRSSSRVRISSHTRPSSS